MGTARRSVRLSLEVNRMRVLGVNAIFHDPSAALVVDGRIVAAAV
jgi:hypothetical protein